MGNQLRTLNSKLKTSLTGFEIFNHSNFKAMKILLWKRHALLSVSALAVVGTMIVINDHNNPKEEERKVICCKDPNVHHVCVMKTILGIDKSPDATLISTFTSNEKVDVSVTKGLDWISKVQGKDGGWGSGSHYNQNVMDPHAVSSDPASTALVAMALLRTDNTLDKGTYSRQLKNSLEFLLKTVENCPDNQPFLTTLQNTQPQTKLGRNIDVILTSQFFTNILRYTISDESTKKRIEKALDKCVSRIQRSQDNDGSWKDGGWAPVLQSALANNALESAAGVGRKVDTSVINRSRVYQNSNFDDKTNAPVTGKAAGVMLYSLSSTTRASATESKEARDLVVKAKKNGLVKNEEVTEENLRAAGADANKAKQLVTAYKINQASQQQAVREDVMGRLWQQWRRRIPQLFNDRREYAHAGRRQLEEVV
jgi:hypothetical protein